MVMGVLVSLSDVFSPKAELLIQKEFEDFKWDGEKKPVWLALDRTQLTGGRGGRGRRSGREREGDGDAR